MKAYMAWDTENDDGASTIVFAETAREAKKIAMWAEACEDAEYINIRVKREPLADSLYKGAHEIDWYDMQTRLVLVKELGWACFETSLGCDDCEAKKWCRHWEEVEKNG